MAKVLQKKRCAILPCAIHVVFVILWHNRDSIAVDKEKRRLWHLRNECVRRDTVFTRAIQSGSGEFVFAYTITIKNTGTVSAQVISRHWIITDAKNHIEEVKGLGVVGHQPFLRQDKVLNTPAAVP
jgi:hypothetical protein